MYFTRLSSRCIVNGIASFIRSCASYEKRPSWVKSKAGCRLSILIFFENEIDCEPARAV